MILTDNINLFWASTIVEVLVINNITEFYISPGSRSTPLVVAIAKNKKANSYIVYDERSAGFSALGSTKNSGKAAVLICTSGSALSHYYPAIIEAEASGIPMIILSADRPIELHNVGANQTTQQIGIFKTHAGLNLNIEAPYSDDNKNKIGQKDVIFITNQIVEHTLSSENKIAHLNIQFREPLAPKKEDFNFKKSYKIDFIEKGPKTESKKDLSIVFNELENAERPLIIIAQNHFKVHDLTKTNIPIFADINSNYHYENIRYFDQLLLSDSTKKQKPDIILIVGSFIVSKRLLQFLNDNSIKIFGVNSSGKNYNPNSNLKQILNIDDSNFLIELSKVRNKNLDWLNSWKNYNSNVSQIINSYSEYSESYISKYIFENLSNEQIFISNSMPIRSADMYSYNKNNIVYSSRGVSGIDGNISTAIGINNSSGKRVFMFVGDLTFIHDLNALSRLKKSDLKIILINNGGGGIFNFLPIAKYDDVFEEFFETPHDHDFKLVCDNFGVKYYTCDNLNSFKDQFDDFKTSNMSSVFEIKLDRRANFDHYKTLQQKIKSALDEL